MSRRRASAVIDSLPDDPALIAAQMQRHLAAAQSAISDLLRELSPGPIVKRSNETLDLFDQASAPTPSPDPASGEEAA